MGNLMAGITGQIKLSNSALTGDFTTIIHGRQNLLLMVQVQNALTDFLELFSMVQ
jgi:hypothetical protein